jgi:hypothetical protein
MPHDNQKMWECQQHALLHLTLMLGQFQGFLSKEEEELEDGIEKIILALKDIL